MISRTLVLEVHSFWHVGTGRGEGAGADSVVLRDSNGLPVVPGRQLKGLLRAAARRARELGLCHNEIETRLFGTPLPDSEGVESLEVEEARFATREGALRIESATLGATPEKKAAWASWARGPAGAAAVRELYRTFASTKIGADGVTADATLRSIEIVVPMTLHATVTGPDDDWPRALSTCLPFVEGVGGHRSRGLGRVTVTLEAP